MIKRKNVILSILLCLIVSSCDSSIFIKVEPVKELRNNKFTVVDYDFTLATTDNTDRLYFEFVMNKKLDDTTPLTFLDQAGSILTVVEAGQPVALLEESADVAGQRSFLYSIRLDDLRSISLVHEIVIGNR